MNREQRRRVGQGRISPEAIKQYEASRDSEIVRLVVHEMNVVMLMMLHDKFGFGPVRLKRAYDSLLESWDAVDKNYVDIKDMERALKEETGLDFTFKPKGVK